MNKSNWTRLVENWRSDWIHKHFGMKCERSELENIPLFYVDFDLEQLFRSKLDDVMRMSEMGLLNLPFPKIVIELDGPQPKMLLAKQTATNAFQIDCLGLEPKLNNTAFVMAHGVNLILSDGELKMNWQAPSVLQTEEELSKLVGIYAEMFFGFLSLLSTKGVDREVIEAPKFINAKRKQKGKPLIPTVTIIKIGHYYDKAGTKHEYTKASPRVHWRRGHIRGVRFGEGRKQIRDRYIFPCLVNYQEGDEKPNHTTRIVKQ